MTEYVIAAIDDEGNRVYWSNDHGWSSCESATVFSPQERDNYCNLPLGGVWEEAPLLLGSVVPAKPVADDTFWGDDAPVAKKDLPESVTCQNCTGTFNPVQAAKASSRPGILHRCPWCRHEQPTLTDAFEYLQAADEAKAAREPLPEAIQQAEAQLGRLDPEDAISPDQALHLSQMAETPAAPVLTKHDWGRELMFHRQKLDGQLEAWAEQLTVLLRNAMLYRDYGMLSADAFTHLLEEVRGDIESLEMPSLWPNERRGSVLAVLKACNDACVATVELGDGEPGSTVDVEIEQLNENSVLLNPSGYGSYDMPDGRGSPIMLEYYEGRLRLVVFPDINDQDAQIIDLEAARESNRKETEA